MSRVAAWRTIVATVLVALAGCPVQVPTPPPGNSKPYDGWQNMFVVVASNTVRPVVVNGKREPVMEGDKNAPYSGCYVNATVSLWTQNNKFGKRVNANLRGIQFLRDGPAFGVAPVDADNEFELLGDQATAGAAASEDFDFA